MKRLVIAFVYCTLMTIILSGCSQKKENNGINESNNMEVVNQVEEVDKTSTESENGEMKKETDLLNQEEAIRIAQEELTEDEKKSVTNFSKPFLEQISFEDEPNIYKYKNEESIAGKQLYKITFHTEQDALLGPIVFYLDASDGQIYGTDYRE